MKVYHGPFVYLLLIALSAYVVLLRTIFQKFMSDNTDLNHIPNKLNKAKKREEEFH